MGNTLYVCAVGCAVNVMKRIHCDEEKKHRGIYVAFHRKLFAQDLG